MSWLIKSLTIAFILTLPKSFSASLACQAKISSFLCQDLSALDDSAYFRVRIVLDASKEGEFSKTEKRPMLIWTEHLMATYQLRSIDNPDSIYNPIIISISPSIHSVMYHNVNARKSEIYRIVSESYVKTIERGCNGKVGPDLCSEMNGREDTSMISFRIYFQDSLERDPTKLEAYLRNFRLNDPKEPSKVLSIEDALRNVRYGYATSIHTLWEMSLDPETRFLEIWDDPRPANSIRESLILKSRSGDHRLMRYQLNGRLTASRRPGDASMHREINFAR